MRDTQETHVVIGVHPFLSCMVLDMTKPMVRGAGGGAPIFDSIHPTVRVAPFEPKIRYTLPVEPPQLRSYV